VSIEAWSAFSSLICGVGLRPRSDLGVLDDVCKVDACSLIFKRPIALVRLTVKCSAIPA
jgi:hypothetical protein